MIKAEDHDFRWKINSVSTKITFTRAESSDQNPKCLLIPAMGLSQSKDANLDYQILKLSKMKTGVKSDVTYGSCYSYAQCKIRMPGDSF